MKKFLVINLVAVALLSSGGGVFAATNPCDPTNGKHLGYCPLEPLPGVTLGNTNIDLPALLSNLFKILFSVGALLATLMLVVGGIEYMVSSVVSLKLEGRRRAQAALFGLLILASSYLILFTINPDLVELKFTQPHAFEVATPTVPAGAGKGTDVSGVSPTVCIAGQTASASSACGQQISAKLGSNGTLINSKTGTAVLILAATSVGGTYTTVINSFTAGCTGVGGTVPPISRNLNNDQIFICVKK
jgi:hypothetical protein